MRSAVLGIVALAPLAPASASPPERAWTLVASLAAYVLPAAPDYLQPTVTADHGWLHLEGRYDYEDLRTGSLFVGWNHEMGGDPKLELTPMLGGIFGRTTGVAPGLAFELTWGRFALHSDSEYVVDVEELADSFFYSWSEAGAALGDHLHAGLVAQRTKLVRTPRELALGPWLGASLWRIDAAVYLFDPFDETRFLVASVAVTF